MLADEVAHVLDDAGHPQIALLGHVGCPGRDLLGGQRRGSDDDHLGARQHASQAHLDVTGAGGHVDEEVVELAPVHVLQELLHGAVEDQSAPHDGAVLVGQEAHRQDPEEPVADAPLQRDHLLGAGLDLALHAEQAGNREPPDVRVQDTDGEPAPGQGHGQVHGDGALAHPALARGDGEHPGGGRDIGGRGGLTGDPPGLFHHRPSLGLVHGTRPDVHRPHAGKREDPALHVPTDLVPQGAAGDGQGHLHVDRSVRGHLDGPDHPEVDDAGPQLGVDHAGQGLAHVFG